MAQQNSANGSTGDAVKLCRRCKEAPSSVMVRSEPLCRDCFVKYVQTKAVKKIGTFRLRNAIGDQKRKLLLPLSFGPSSMALLNILHTHLQAQEKRTGWRSLSLHLTHVPAAGDQRKAAEELLKQTEERFPGHEYSIRPLSAFFDLDDGNEVLKSLGIRQENASESPENKLHSLLRALPSTTAQADVVLTLRTRLLAQIAKDAECEGILWGDSTTKLAERTLAEAAKGRGFSLAHQLLDGEAPLGVTNYYPLKELLKKELVAYVDLYDPPLTPFVVHEPVSKQIAVTKNTTIDELMTHYFASVEENYPSIVANVVRTADRLQPLPTTEATETCELCKLPVSDGRFGISGWGGDQGPIAAQLDAVAKKLCYGCTRSIPATGR